MAASKTKSKPLIDPEDLLTRDDIEFEDFLDELGPEIATVSIFRVLRDGSREHVDKVPLSELIANVYGWLRDQCGVGKYQLYFRGEDKRYRGAKTVSVGERKVNGVAPATTGNGHHDWMEKQMAMQQTMITGMISAMKGPDVGTLLQGVAALAPKPAAQPDPSVMLTAVATVFATLRGPQKDEDWLTRAKTIIELAKDLQPEDRGGDTGWTVVKDVGKAVVDKLGMLEPKAALPAAQHTTTITVPVNGRSPNDDPASHPSAMPPAETPRTMPQNAADWIRVALGYLKEKAKLFKDPEIYVDQILDNIEEPQNAAIVGAIREGAQFEDLLLFDSEIGENDGYRNWFRKVYDGVHTELFTSMDSARAGGNGSDTSHDARSRTAGQSPS